MIEDEGVKLIELVVELMYALSLPCPSLKAIRSPQSSTIGGSLKGPQGGIKDTSIINLSLIWRWPGLSQYPAPLDPDTVPSRI